jgi:tetratricopeptide (TPR) repeat protein
MLNLAAVTRNQGKYAQAEELFERILGIQRWTLGDEHPDTLATLDLLALQYREEGKFAQSETLFAQSLALRRRVLGKEHPETLQTMTALAVLYRVNGKYAEAEALFGEALEIARRALGEEHPLTVGILAELPGGLRPTTSIPCRSTAATYTLLAAWPVRKRRFSGLVSAWFAALQLPSRPALS